MIVFRADGSNTTGAGHLMRCMTIADAFPNKDRILFVTNSEESARMVAERGFDAVVLKTYEGRNPSEVSIEKELPELKKILKDNRATYLMVDSYRVTDDYLEKLKAITVVGLIEDKGDHKYPVNLILNYNIFADSDKMDKMYGTDAMILCGADYIPIREPFCEARYTVFKKVRNVLILTGGGDAFNLADKFVDFFGNREDGIKYHLVSGFYANSEPLRRKIEKCNNIEFYSDIKDIWNLMVQCDIAVSAGGTTVYELMAVGVPVVGYTFADNQKPLMEYIKEKDIFPTCGDYRNEGDNLLKNIDNAIISLTEQTVRKEISFMEQSIVTGNGASYTKEAINYCINKNA